VRRVPVWIGTSGWQYRHWRERFYLRGLPTERWFDRYAETFRTVELNVTFYRQPRPAVFEGWARRAPEGFVFAVKASRFLTHIRRLREPRDSIDILLEGASRLGPHLGPILLQLPPDMEVEAARLDETLTAFTERAPAVRIAVEPRHSSWFVEPVREVLVRHRAALCLADRRGTLTPDWATTDWGYVRFHSGRSTPPGCYRDVELAGWSARLASMWPDRAADVFAYFNNDGYGCALRDAGRFESVVAEVGLDPTTTGTAESTTVG
jgi:uncharacterized protein YecE (DUF72 family)